MKKLIVLLILSLLLVPFVMAEEKVGFDFQKEWLDMSVEQRREYVPKLRKDIPISEKCLRDAKSFNEYWACEREVAIEEAVAKENKVKAEGVTAGMGGLRWGSTIEEFSAMKKPSPDPLITGLYHKGTPVTFGRRFYSIGELELLAIYSFYKNKFYYFSIKTDSSQGEVIKHALTSKYGQPKGINPLVLYVNPNAKVGTGYSWEVRDVSITFNINEMKDESHLSYI